MIDSKILLVGAFSAALLSPASQSSAQAASGNLCRSSDAGSLPPDDLIIRCSKVIESKQDKGASLAEDFRYRANGYLQKHDFEHSLADLSEAIRLNPRAESNFLDRAFVYGEMDDADRAIADYSEAIRLAPGDARAYQALGFGYVNKQDYQRAFANYSEAIRIDPNDGQALSGRGIVYFLQANFAAARGDLAQVSGQTISAFQYLWLYLSRARSGEASTGRTELESNAAKISRPGWYYSMIEMFLERRTPAETLAAQANDEDRCKAQFYIGELYIQRGARTDASSALRAAIGTCPKNYPEYFGAVEELKNLGG